MDCKLFLENGTESVHVANFYFVIKDSGVTGAVGKEIHVDFLEDMVKETILNNKDKFIVPPKIYTRDEYNQLPTKDSNTLYFISEV